MYYMHPHESYNDFFLNFKQSTCVLGEDNCWVPAPVLKGVFNLSYHLSYLSNLSKN